MREFDPTKDYYTLLGVPRDAPIEDVKNAYRELAKRWHPDVNKASEAESTFASISEAHAVLTNAATRASYDSIRFSSAHYPQMQAPTEQYDWQDGGSSIEQVEDNLARGQVRYSYKVPQEKYRTSEWRRLSLGERKAFRAGKLAKAHPERWFLLLGMACAGAFGCYAYRTCRSWYEEMHTRQQAHDGKGHGPSSHLV